MGFLGNLFSSKRKLTLAEATVAASYMAHTMGVCRNEVYKRFRKLLIVSGILPVDFSETLDVGSDIDTYLRGWQLATMVDYAKHSIHQDSITHFEHALLRILARSEDDRQFISHKGKQYGRYAGNDTMLIGVVFCNLSDGFGIDEEPEAIPFTKIGPLSEAYMLRCRAIVAGLNGDEPLVKELVTVAEKLDAVALT